MGETNKRRRRLYSHPIGGLFTDDEGVVDLFEVDALKNLMRFMEVFEA